MTDSGNGGSAGDGRSTGFGAGLAVGAIVTFIVTAALVPIAGFISYPVCFLLDRSDDFLIGSYDRALESLKEIRLQEDDLQREVEARTERLAFIHAEMDELTERRKICISAQAPQQLSEQDTPECTGVTEEEYSKQMNSREKLADYHSSERHKEEDKLFEIRKESDFRARHMGLQITERAKLPEVCHKFFDMRTLDDIMNEPIRPAPFSLW